MNRPASSLVLVTLSMAAVAVVILAGSRALIQSLRTRSSLDSASNARVLSEAAIQEGMQRVRKGAAGGLDGYGQYGTWNLEQATLEPLTRGFSDANCSQVVEKNYTTDCGTYKVAVRTIVKGDTYDYQVQDLPGGSELDLVIAKPGRLGFTLRTSVDGVLAQARFDIQVYIAGRWSQKQRGVTNYSVPTTATAFRITMNYGGATPSATDVALTAEQNGTLTVSGDQFAIQKGYTTIEGTGLAADGSQYRTVVVFRPDFTKRPGFSDPGGTDSGGTQLRTGPDRTTTRTGNVTGGAAGEVISAVDGKDVVATEDTVDGEIVPRINGFGGFASGPYLIRRNISPKFKSTGFCEPYQELCR